MAVKGEEVHGKLFKLIGDGGEIGDDVGQRSAGKLLQHHLHQSNVADLETAPQRVDILHAEVQRVLADERRLPASRRPREDRQFPPSVALQQLRQNRKPSPADPRRFRHLRYFGVDVVPEFNVIFMSHFNQ